MEQKNWSHVRQLLGYDRFDDLSLVPLINAIYVDIWEPLNNFFMPSMKLLSKERHGAKIKRHHDKPMTPCDRLLQSEHLSKETKRKLIKQRASLNPFELHRELENKLRALHYTLRTRRPMDDLHCATNAGNMITTSVS